MNHQGGFVNRKFSAGVSLLILAVFFGYAAIFGYSSLKVFDQTSQAIAASENNLANETEAPITLADLVTSKGTIEIEFLSGFSTSTIKNFVKLAQNGFYDQTKFHRVIANFMIQGGDPLSKGTDETVYGTGGPGYTFADEVNDYPMIRGVVAMANSGPNTNGSQFFIITAKTTPWLQGKHTVFARVVLGMDIVMDISRAQTDARDVPASPVVIEKIILK